MNIYGMMETFFLCLRIRSKDGWATGGQQKLEDQPFKSGGRTETGPGEEKQPGEGIQIHRVFHPLLHSCYVVYFIY